MHIVASHLDQIKALCGANKVKALFVFGSALRDDFSGDSDIDLVVDIEAEDPLTYSARYFNLKFQLASLLQRDIDLLENTAIKNPYLREEIDKTKVLIYGTIH